MYIACRWSQTEKIICHDNFVIALTRDNDMILPIHWSNTTQIFCLLFILSLGNVYHKLLSSTLRFRRMFYKILTRQRFSFIEWLMKVFPSDNIMLVFIVFDAMITNHLIEASSFLTWTWSITFDVGFIH